MDKDMMDAMVNSSSRISRRRSSVAKNTNSNLQVVKLSFELNIRRLFLVNTPDDVKYRVLWVRGGKKIDTRKKPSQGG